MVQNSKEPRILVVDDDKHVRTALKRTFLHENWQVVCAASGREAFEILSQQPAFNVVVADYFMPHVNGIEFLTHVGRKYPHIYCIMLTAYPYCDAIKHALSKTTNAILLDKPWDEQLTQIISRVLKEQQQTQRTHRA